MQSIYRKVFALLILRYLDITHAKKKDCDIIQEAHAYRLPTTKLGRAEETTEK